MPNIRRNHQTKGRGATSGFVIRGFIYIGLICLLLLVLFQLIKKLDGSPLNTFALERADSPAFFLPIGSQGELIKHKYYYLSYNESTEQADWVAYILKKEELKIPNVNRSRKYFKDPSVSTESAHHKDYSNSGYTRGHLAPAGDMAFSEEAMRESFYMSNMSPQNRAFNNGVWKELEESIRDWAFQEDELIVVTGPIFHSDRPDRIGQARVAVPDAFFKIVLDITAPDYKAIAFVIPNEKSEAPLSQYAVSIDSIEQITKFDFFADLLDDEEEDVLENTVWIDNWPFSEKRFELRLNKWNNQ